MWHGVFLLLCVALIPTILHRIPLAALAAMLIYTGFRLTHPREFMHVYKVGSEQLAIFVATLVGVLATDLLIGIIIGIAVKLAIHLYNGVPIRSLFKSFIEVEEQGEDTIVVTAKHSAVFTNWILLRRQLIQHGLAAHKNVVIDFSDCTLVDHSVMEKLHELEDDFHRAGLRFEQRGLGGHDPLSHHELAARKRVGKPLRRITIVGPSEIEGKLCDQLIELGASGVTYVPCRGRGRSNREATNQVRVETIVSRSTMDSILDYLKREVETVYKITTSVDDVDVLRPDNF
jgi:MFS superfamily sulfate permease-like transporter